MATSGINFKLTLLAAIVLACIVSSICAATGVADARAKLFRERRSAMCLTPQTLDKKSVWACRENYVRDGADRCCSGYSCLCGIRLSYYATTSMCRCIGD